MYPHQGTIIGKKLLGSATLTMLLAMVLCYCCAEEAPQESRVPSPLIAPARFADTDDKWGLLSAKGEEILPPTYLEAQQFSNGLAAVMTKDGWGYIDTTGKTVIPHKYAYAGNYSHGYAPVCMYSKLFRVPHIQILRPPARSPIAQGRFTSGTWMFIDKDEVPLCDEKGNELRYRYAKPFRNGLAEVFNYSNGNAFIDSDGKEQECYIDSEIIDLTLVEGIDDSIEILTDENKGKQSFKGIEGSFDEVCKFCNGLAAVKLGTKWGYIDIKGKMAISARFDKAGYFGTDFAFAYLEGNWIFIDRTGASAHPEVTGYTHLYGNLVEAKTIEQVNGEALILCSLYTLDGTRLIPPLYESIEVASNSIPDEFDEDFTNDVYPQYLPDYIVARTKTATVVLSLKGKPLCSFPFTSIDVFHGLVIAHTDSKQTSLYSISGTQLLSPADWEITRYANGLLSARIGNGNYRVFCRKGELKTNIPVTNCEYMPGRWLKIESASGFGAISAYPERIVEPVLDDIQGFNGSSYAACINGLWGHIDAIGQVVTPPAFDEAHVFSEGLARVKRDGYYGYINTMGELVIPCRYTDTLDCKEGICLVKHEAADCYGFINEKGKELGSKHYDHISPFSCGMARVKKKGWYGYVNTNLQEVITPKFKFAGNFSGGLAPVKIDNKWGYIRENGDFAIEPCYTYADEFYRGRASVYFDGKWELIDKDGNKLSANESSKLRSPSPLAISNEAGEWGFIDKQLRFRKILNARYKFAGRDIRNFCILKDGMGSHISAPYSTIKNVGNGLYSFAENGKKGLMDRNATIILQPTYKQIGSFRGGCAIVTNLEGRKNYLSHSLKLLLAKWVDDCTNFEDGYAIITVNGNHGVVNDSGEILLEPSYDKLICIGKGAYKRQIRSEWKIIDVSMANPRFFDSKEAACYLNGFYSFYENGLVGLAKIDGTEILSPFFEQIHPLTDEVWECRRKGFKYLFSTLTEETRLTLNPYRLAANRFSEGKGKLFAVFDNSLVQLTDYTFERICEFSNGYSAVKVDDSWGYINIAGEIAIHPCFNIANSFHSGIAFVHDGEKYGAIDKDGNTVLPFRFASTGKVEGDYIVFSEYIPRPGSTRSYGPLQVDVKKTAYNRKGELCTTEYLKSRREIGLYKYITSTTKNDERKWRRFDITYPSEFDYTSVSHYASSPSEGKSILACMNYSRAMYNYFEIQPPKLEYTDIRAFQNGLGVVKEQRTWLKTTEGGEDYEESVISHTYWGAVDKEGEIVIPFSFDWLGSFVAQGRALPGAEPLRE